MGCHFSLCTLRFQKFVEAKQVEALRPRSQRIQHQDSKIFGCTIDA